MTLSMMMALISYCMLQRQTSQGQTVKKARDDEKRWENTIVSDLSSEKTRNQHHAIRVQIYAQIER